MNMRSLSCIIISKEEISFREIGTVYINILTPIILFLITKFQLHDIRYFFTFLFILIVCMIIHGCYLVHFYLYIFIIIIIKKRVLDINSKIEPIIIWFTIYEFRPNLIVIIAILTSKKCIPGIIRIEKESESPQSKDCYKTNMYNRNESSHNCHMFTLPIMS